MQSKSIRQILCTLPLLISKNTIALECDNLKVGGGSWLYQDVRKDSVAQKSIDLLGMISSTLDVSLMFEPNIPFARQLKQLDDGDIDIVVGIYPTEQRRQRFALSESYHFEELFVFSNNSQPKSVQTIEELNLLIGAKIRGASYGELIDDLYSRKERAIEVNTQIERNKLLAIGRVDYFIGSMDTVINKKEMQMITRSNQPIYKQPVVLGMSITGECKQLLKPINKIIRKYFRTSE